MREARGGTGRNRPWQAVSEGLEWGEATEEAEDAAGDRLAAEALTDMLVEREVQRLRAARASRDSEPPAWREATGLMQSQLWLTAEEAQQLRERADRAAAPARRALTSTRALAPDGRPAGARWSAGVVPAAPGTEPTASAQTRRGAVA